MSSHPGGKTLIADRYRLDSLVGKGSVGEVWETEDVLLERIVALKLVDLENNNDPAIEERFRREGIAIAGLNHPNIVKVYDTGTDDNKAFLVMDLLSGPNLASLVRETGQVDPVIGMQLLTQVAEGLQHAHDQGITHRDVKPANIVLDTKPAPDGTKPDLFSHPENGLPILVDFGIARLMGESEAQLTGTATAIGTAAYMSPEQAMNTEINEKSDVYSLGCVAYFLLTGQPPFIGDSSVAVAHAQVYDDPLPLLDFVHDAPPALDGLLARMLAKKPEYRPTASQVADEMRAIIDDPEISPKYLASPAQPPERGFWARNASRILIGVLIAGLLALLAYAWTRPNRDPGPTPTVTLTQTQVSTKTASASAEQSEETEEPSDPAPIPQVTDNYPGGNQGGNNGPAPRPTYSNPPPPQPTTTVTQYQTVPAQTAEQETSQPQGGNTIVAEQPVIAGP